MTEEYKQGWRWIVWVGGTDDYYKDIHEQRNMQMNG